MEKSGHYDPGEITLDNCDKEPIHLIGKIQPHGALIGCDLGDGSTPLKIHFVSDNIGALFDTEPDTLIGTALDAVFSKESMHRLHQCLDASSPDSSSALDITLKHSGSRHPATVHVHKTILCIEFETVFLHTTPRAGFKAGALQALSAFSRGVIQSKNFDALGDFLARFFFDQLNYDRVMVYIFDHDGHGEVVAEVKNPDLEPFLNLHYPASDIPQFARYLYVQNRCRIITSVTEHPANIISGDDKEFDLRFSSLRSMSPIHIEYLSNMGVEATLTMSIVKDNKLHGMVIMHNYSPRYCELQDRQTIKQMSLVCSDYLDNLQRIESAEHSDRSQDLGRIIGSYLLDRGGANFKACADAILTVMKGDGILIVLNDTKVYSEGLIYDDIPAFMAATNTDTARASALYSSNHLAQDGPQLFALDSRIAGLMIINIPSDKRSFIAIARREKAETVNWAGRKEEYVQARDGRLHPRRSFKLWKEVKKFQSAAWGASEQLYGKAIRYNFIRYVLRHNEQCLARLAAFDSLTDLPNRELITRRIDALIAEKQGMALFFIDCDRFKSINDSLGHEVGDKVLCEVAATLRTFAQQGTTVARLGGDEFTILAETTDQEAIEDLAKNIVEKFRSTLAFQHYNFHVPVSIGVAISDAFSTRSSLMRNADMAMYEAKKAGGNDYKFVDDSTILQADKRLLIEQSLYLATEKNQIKNYYQPIVSSQTKKIVGLEVLCRWVTDEKQVLTPDKFLRIAEETGIIIQIGREVIKQALDDCERIKSIRKDIELAINFSPLQMMSHYLGEYLVEEIHRRKLDPVHFGVEITEESYIDDEAAIIERIEFFKNAGLRIAIDDFGSGYSSLGYLSKLPIDVVKFDKSLVAHIATNENGFRLVEACQRMADACSLESIAEGVESLQQEQLLLEIGVDYLQGYKYSRPIPVDDLIELIEQTDQQVS